MANKKDRVPVLVVRKGATLREIYSRARQEFTASDLQKYTEIEDGIPMDKIIAEMEAIQCRQERKRSKKQA